MTPHAADRRQDLIVDHAYRSWARSKAAQTASASRAPTISSREIVGRWPRPATLLLDAAAGVTAGSLSRSSLIRGSRCSAALGLAPRLGFQPLAQVRLFGRCCGRAVGAVGVLAAVGAVGAGGRARRCRGRIGQRRRRWLNLGRCLGRRVRGVDDRRCERRQKRQEPQPSESAGLSCAPPPRGMKNREEHPHR